MRKASLRLSKLPVCSATRRQGLCAPDPPPDEAGDDPTPAQRSAVRRASEQTAESAGLVVKLGMYPGERSARPRRPRERAGYRSQRRAAIRIAIAQSLSTASARTVCQRDCRGGMNHKNAVRVSPLMPRRPSACRWGAQLGLNGSHLTPKQRRWCKRSCSIAQWSVRANHQMSPLGGSATRPCRYRHFSSHSVS